MPKVVAPPPARRYSLAERRDEYSELYSPQLKERDGTEYALRIQYEKAEGKEDGKFSFFGYPITAPVPDSHLPMPRYVAFIT